MYGEDKNSHTYSLTIQINKCKFAEKKPQEDKHWVRGITRFVYKNIY